MAKGKLQVLKGQRGQALVLVLIALALGSLLIPPTLRYVSTGLTERRVSEEFLLQRYAADAAAEYTMWQLKYNVDGLTDRLGLENPSSSTSLTVNGFDVSVTTEISQSPTADTGQFPAPGYEQGIHLASALEIRPPVWSPSGKKANFTHVVYIFNFGTSQVHLKAAFQQLPPGFTYVENSYNGPNTRLTKSYVGGQWGLRFDFKEPLPRLQPQQAMFISFVAWTQEDMGEYTYTGSGWVSYAGFQEEELVCYTGISGLASFGLYDITVTVGSYALLINVGITESGETVLRSWQFQ